MAEKPTSNLFPICQGRSLLFLHGVVHVGPVLILYPLFYSGKIYSHFPSNLEKQNEAATHWPTRKVGFQGQAFLQGQTKSGIQGGDAEG